MRDKAPNALWWAAAAVLVFALLDYGRGGPDGRGRWSDSGYGEYRDHRDRQDRRDREHHR
ncbi:hypothetical protein [Streptomyces luteocolor]|uniref:hypothetical protein n=1 Tax=Streptomyces luteocolor TaxID=285500 RepID=UPI000853CEAC|nr:hypothetical protein [Streptomyces luteocolor]